MNEIWKDIKNYEGIYQISNMGRIKSIERTIIRKNGKKLLVKEKILKQNLRGKNNNKYYHITLQGKCFRVNRLIAETFIPNPNNLPCVNHKDENKLNNKVTNLEWCTYRYNNTYNNIHKKNAEKRKIKINQYTLDNKFIKTWNSFIDIKNYFGWSHALECCEGKRKTSNGYIWKYY